MEPKRRIWTGLLAATGIFLVLVVSMGYIAEDFFATMVRLASTLGLRSSGGTYTIAGQNLPAPPMWYYISGGLLFYVCALFVPLWLAIWAYHRIARRPPYSDGYTHCGKCGYILKGLTEPRCPECGQAI